MSLAWEDRDVETGPSDEETELLFTRLQEMLDARVTNAGPGGPSCCGRIRRCRGCPRY